MTNYIICHTLGPLATSVWTLSTKATYTSEHLNHIDLCCLQILNYSQLGISVSFFNSYIGITNLFFFNFFWTEISQDEKERERDREIKPKRWLITPWGPACSCAVTGSPQPILPSLYTEHDILWYKNIPVARLGQPSWPCSLPACCAHAHWQNMEN